MITLSKLSIVLTGEFFGDDSDVSNWAGRINTDTRSLKRGDIYLALRGANFDGNQFTESAQKKGALAVISETYHAGLSISQIVVKDGFKALSTLAAYYRTTLKAKVCAITGSVGKTTVKGMLKEICIAAVGSQEYVNATYKNLNNYIGVPKTILETQESTEYLIVEAGMSHPGEIAPLTKIIDPDVALVNNIAPCHIEAFESIDGIAIEKTEIYHQSNQRVTCIVNADDKYAPFCYERCEKKVKIDFSISSEREARVVADDIVTDELGRASFLLCVRKNQQSNTRTDTSGDKIKLQVLGVHNIQNALAASTCALAMNIKIKDIVKGLHAFSGESGRMQCVELGSLRIIDDTYNANPESMKAAIRYLAKLKDTVLILGDMGELGDYADQAHFETAAFAKQQGVKHLYVSGEYSSQYEKGFGEGITITPSKEHLVEKILFDIAEQNISPMSTILVKGSRNSKMEYVVQCLQKSGVFH